MLARIGVISFAPFSKRRASRVSQKTKAKRTVLLIYQQQQLQLLLDGSIVVYHFTLLIIIIGERVHNEMEKSLFATQIIYNGNRGSLLIPIKTVIRYYWGGLKMFVHCNSELLKSLKPRDDHFCIFVTNKVHKPMLEIRNALILHIFFIITFVSSNK